MRNLTKVSSCERVPMLESDRCPWWTLERFCRRSGPAWEIFQKCHRVKGHQCLRVTDVPGDLANPWEILSCRSGPPTNPLLAEDFTRDPWQLIVWTEAPFIVWRPKLPRNFSLKPWEFFFLSASCEKGFWRQVSAITSLVQLLQIFFCLNGTLI